MAIIDVSEWQGKIDWSEVAKDENVKFAILRAGYGMYTSQKDDRFEEYYAGCKRYNIPVGAYWFSYATTKEEAIQEAKSSKRISSKKIKSSAGLDFFKDTKNKNIKVLKKKKKKNKKKRK